MHTEIGNIGFPPPRENSNIVFSETCLGQAGREPEWFSEPEVMIVTDQFAVTQALGTILKEQDCQIYLAPEFRTAVEDLQNYSVDLLIIQMSRRNKTGLAAIQQAKQAGAKVMLISGPQGCDLPAESFEVTVDDYLIFPFTTAQLRRKVAALLAPAPVFKEKSRAEEVNARALKSLQFLMAEIRSSLTKVIRSLNLSENGDRGPTGPRGAGETEEILREISHVIGLTDDFHRKTSHLAQFSDW
jgi:response regulator RpfG family c-di-GMP phosphodiesterase